MKLVKIGRYLLSFGSFICIWITVSFIIKNPIILPQFHKVVVQFFWLIFNSELLSHILISLKRIIISYSLSGAVAISLGVIIGISRPLEDFLDPIIQLLRPISGIAWIPFAMFIFGIGGTVPRFIIFYAAFFPFILNTIGGIKGIDINLIRAARTFGAKPLMIFKDILLPGALPAILTGARLAMGVAWASLIVSEFVGSTSGIGYKLSWYRDLLMTSKVLAVVFTIGVLGYTCDILLRYIHRYLTPWHQETDVLKRRKEITQRRQNSN